MAKRGRPKVQYRGAGGETLVWSRGSREWESNYGKRTFPVGKGNIWTDCGKGLFCCLCNMWVWDICPHCEQIRRKRMELRIAYIRFGEGWLYSRRVTAKPNVKPQRDHNDPFAIPDLIHRRYYPYGPLPVLNLEPLVGCKCRRYALPAPGAGFPANKINMVFKNSVEIPALEG